MGCTAVEDGYSVGVISGAGDAVWGVAASYAYGSTAQCMLKRKVLLYVFTDAPQLASGMAGVNL
jgi:hypothetical protein